MKWKYYLLKEDDSNAKSHIFANLSMGIYQKCLLSEKLFEKFAAIDGQFVAIAMESLDLELIADYRWAGIYQGKQLRDAIDTPKISVGDRPIDGLVRFLSDYLNSSSKPLVVIEDFWNTSYDIATKEIGHRLAFFKQRVYHLLTKEDTSPDVSEDAIRVPWNQWFVGLCADNITMPKNAEWTERFLDEITASTQHIFVPAFDDEGFLVWTPKGL
ncbi:MAG: hypothetical protein IT427_04635 [Pirellulales bacterium]|nr:hypothetical protein [Pirellulales bacterium]